MSKATSWQRYDETHNVSEILTDAARACVEANPFNVADFFARYFREVSAGTTVRRLEMSEVVSGKAGTALRFVLLLCKGFEVSLTTGDIATTVPAAGATSEEVQRANRQKFILCVGEVLLSQLLTFRIVEPQRGWDEFLSNTWYAPFSQSVALPVQWGLSVLAALAAAKQRGRPLYQYLDRLMEVEARPMEERSFALTEQSPSRSVVDAAIADGKHYAPPDLFVTFLVNSAKPGAAEAAGLVHFSRVYVGFHPLPMPTSGEEREPPAEAGPVEAVDGTLLRRRVRQLYAAAEAFVDLNPMARILPDGCVHWSGAASLSEVVRVVSDALEVVGLRPGFNVSIGLSLGASTMRVRSGGAEGTGNAASNKAPAANADTSGLYNVFLGEAPITGEQLTTYVREQVEEMEPGVMQMLEDTHSFDDTVARQRLQLALQETVIFATNTAGEGQPTADTGSDYATQRVELVVAGGGCTATVIDPPRCGTVFATAQLLIASCASALAATTSAVNVPATVGGARSAVAVWVGAAAGDATASAHLVDVAFAGRAGYVMTSTGPLSVVTMSVVSRLATIVEELQQREVCNERVPFQRYNLHLPEPLPELEVAVIKRKGDKKKKEVRRTSLKKK